ncbi:MAG: RNA recognition motif domain-containing protein [Candidatus Kapaibacterium sp.]
MKLFIGGISYETTEAEVTNLLSPFGEVDKVHVAMDKETNKSKGFAFANMPNDELAKKAIAGLDQTSFSGRTITVREAHAKKGFNTPAPEMSLAGQNHAE